MRLPYPWFCQIYFRPDRVTGIPEPSHSFSQIYFLNDRYSRTHTQLLSIFAFYMTDIPEPTHSFYQIYFHHDRYFRAHTQPLSNLFPTWQIFQRPYTASVKFISTMTGIPEPTHIFCQNLFTPWHVFQSPHIAQVLLSASYIVSW